MPALGMRFVTGEAGRFEAVGCVARYAGNFRVLAREFGQLVADRAVAVEADVCKLGRRRDLARGVRIAVAGTAFLDLWPVKCFMAGRTLGHDRIPIPLARVIGVKDGYGTAGTRSGACRHHSSGRELADVALGALGRGERLRFSGILPGGRRYGNRCDLFPGAAARDTPVSAMAITTPDSIFLTVKIFDILIIPPFFYQQVDTKAVPLRFPWFRMQRALTNTT